MFVAPEIPASFSTTSSVTSEKFSKFSSTTSTSFQDVFSSESTNFKQEQQSAVKQPQQSAPAPFKPQQQQQFAPVQQTTPKPYQPAGQSFPPLKPQTPVSFNKPQTPVSFNKTQTPVNVAPSPKPQQQAPAVSPAPTKPLTPISIPSPRSGLNASPVTPGILKKQIQLDAAVPVPPGGVVGNSQSPVPSYNGRLSGKSPVPFVNTAPAPFNPQFPPLSVQTPETIAQIAPNETPLVPPLRNPAEIPMPLIVSTPLPKYSNCYNNAARPFNEFKDYYKPIHMEEGKKLLPPLIYTDF
ncbi:hypothetical protein PVAND_003206 [Polypedilum vanderplanki]|uniref:Uncharacterized protein n=1 Tax=Polypedilum vanderplanki TaxID=319348 RepID=A0A9J6BV24_POLVA|nr:hypothetical protein PVAND_003206 [Polypedilum vanderplanki]